MFARNSSDALAERRPPRWIVHACRAVLLATPVVGAAHDAALSRDDALWLERVTYGLDSATVQRFRELGRRRFLDEQLAGRNDKLPDAIQAQIDALDIQHTPVAQLVVDEIAEQKRINATRRRREEEGRAQGAQRTRQQVRLSGDTT